MTINNETVIAANRFGLGARPGDLQTIGDSPREWLFSQIENQQPLLRSVGNIPDSKTAISEFLEFRGRTMRALQSGKAKGADPKDVMRLGQVMRPMYQQHVLARSIQAVQSNTPFYERLVHFWSNHFAVSADEAFMFGIVGSLEFEAIRPNITGHFTEMLFAVEKHPAMLMYLDNQQSIGPNSTLAQRAGHRARHRKFDINENLAREILELHTLGVDGGYTQEDIKNFARVITGWSFGGIFPRHMGSSATGEFQFNELIHEPGPQRILNKTYRQPGVKQGEAVLRDLALHPATARYVATKLARHFISDDPPAAVINNLSSAYLQSDGYLPAVYKTLVSSNEAWQETFTKYKTPKEFVYSLYRSINHTPERPQQIIQPLFVLGQQPFKPGSPAGWPDTTRDWSGGEALFKRIEFATTVANRIGNRIVPEQLAREILGNELGDHTRIAINRAESASQGLTLLFSSPEFQRR